MSNKAKTKTKAAPAAQSREAAEAAIGRIGANQRQLARINADLGDEVAKITALAEAEALPLKAAIEADQELVQGWCEANRDGLTRNGKVKFAELTTGVVKWRSLPPKVSLRGVEAIIEALKAGGPRLRKFLRTKVEINKDAMLADPELAATVRGVTIASDGEEFVIEPHDAALAEQVAA